MTPTKQPPYQSPPPQDGMLPLDESTEETQEGSPEQGAGTSMEQAGYTGPEQRCATCEYSSDEGDKCNKFGFEILPEGHCNSWEPPAAGDAEYDEEDDEDATEDLALEVLE